MVIKMKIKKTKKSKKKEIVEDVIVKDEKIGEILPLTADEDNPVSDGLEFRDGDKDE